MQCFKKRRLEQIILFIFVHDSLTQWEHFTINSIIRKRIGHASLNLEEALFISELRFEKEYNRLNER